VGNLGTSKQSNDTFERKCDELVVKMAHCFQFFFHSRRLWKKKLSSKLKDTIYY